ncbi:MAG: 2-C-methyl-D-erythritol 4-phosphate cytidylyltransferase [Spirochaetales bacterium]|nr:2-C-methyl-D-erythritol 4-phosphate cytidylyltransferase [Spirochaetales bacterium]
MAIILAAGSSTRMGAGIKKEYMTFNGRPLLYHGVETFIRTGLFDRILMVCREDFLKKTEEMLGDFSFLEYISGGSTRQESVFKALQYLSEQPPEIVLIHDGARPFVSSETIHRVLKKSQNKGACIPTEPSTNTMKIVDREGKIVTHLKRSVTKGAQTPQGFLFPPLYEAHKSARLSGEEFTDDSEIWDRFAGSVFTVEGNLENDKITYQSDLSSLGITLKGEER